MSTRSRVLRGTLASLLILSAVGFAVAANVERAKEREGAAPGLNAPEGSAAREAAERTSATTTPSTQGSTTSTSAPTPPTSANPLSAPEGSPAREAAERARRNGATTTSTLPPPVSGSPQPVTSTTQAAPAASSTLRAPPQSSPEALFGIHTESTATTTIAVALLIGAAVVALWARKRWPLLVVAALTSLFALLDTREAWHQHQEARPGLVTAAVALALTHAVASALSIAAPRP
jgi:hypothetical protein